MTQTFVPGWDATITIDSEDVGIVGNVLQFNRARGGLAKPVFGSPFRREIPGQGSGTVTAEGHVSVEKLPALEAMYASDVAVPYTIQVGTSAGATDAGDYAGNLVVTALEINTDAEGEWEWRLTGNLDGAPVYTAPT